MDKLTIKDQLNANQEKINDISAKITIACTQLKDLNAAKSALIAMNKNLIAELKKADKRPSELTVTDHALVRYLERFVGLDIEAMKQTIIDNVNPKVPCGKVPFKDGFKFVIQDNCIVTIV